MTVSTATTRHSFAGTGSAFSSGSTPSGEGPFSVTFTVLDASHITVYWTKGSSGSGTPTVISDSGNLTKDTHYTIQNAGTTSNATITYIEAGWTSGSTVTYPTSADLIVISRNVPLTQVTNYQNNATIDAETIESSFDKVTQTVQQLDDVKDYSFKFATNLSGSTGFNSTSNTASTITALKADRAGKFLAFDADGDITTSISTDAHIDSTSPASGHVLIHNGTKYVNVAILDSDTMSGASATTVASSESIKAYVDAEILTEDTIAELNDTTITGTPADNEFLAYDSGSSKWINQTATEAGLGTAATKDVGIGNTNVLAANAAVADNDFLRVDGTSVEGRTASEVVSDLSAMTTNSDSTLSAGVDINMSTTGKIAQKGAFLQSSTHQALFLGA
jgi:hypothetical protein